MKHAIPAVLLAIVALLARGALAREDDRPNIILILADDLGYRELGCYGQEKIRTPTIDRLAFEGMRFTRFYSASTVCAPARSALMTGLHTGHTVVRGNKEVGGWGPEDGEGQWPIPDETVTLGERMRAIGYRTAAMGKWGLGGPGSSGRPSAQGFDHFYGYLCQRVAHNFYPTHLWRNDDVDVQHSNRYFKAHQRLEAPLDSDGAYLERYRGGDFAPEEILKEAEGWIGANADEPFFLYFPTTLPHVALQAPSEFVDRYPREWDEEAYLGQKGYLPSARPRATYAAMIEYIDHSVDRLLKACEAAGVLENTLIIVTSDNGTTYAGGCDREFFDSLGELRGYKTNLYEGGIRVPLIAWWPGRIGAGGVSDHVGQLQDLHATILEIAGAESAIGTDGISLTPTLFGSGRQPEHAAMYWEFPEGRQQQAVLLDGRWKAIRPDLKGEGLRMELYDLQSDPGETNDISGERPGVVERAERAMRAMRTPSALFPIPALDAEAED